MSTTFSQRRPAFAEVAQWLSERAAFPEEPGSVPSSQGGLQLSLTPVAGDPMPSDGLRSHQGST